VNEQVKKLKEEKERFANQLEAKRSFGEAGETQPGKRATRKNAKRN
jgi:hypothetical protein